MQIDNILEKGTVLMNRALQEYEEGNYEHAAISRKQANETFDLLDKFVNTEEGADTIRYNENRNFGIIYKVIEENAKNLFSNKDESKKIAKIISEIKNNKVLHEQFLYYNALTNPTNVVDANDYTKETLSIAPHYTPKELRENNSKLIKLIKKLNINEDVYISRDEMKLFESIEWSIINKKNTNNINEFIDNSNILIESVKENNKIINEDKDYNNKLKNLTEKYNNELNEDEKEFLEEMTNPLVNKEKKFNEYKNTLLETISKKMQTANESEIANYKEWQTKINEKKYTKENYISDIADMINVQNILDE